MRVSYCGAFEIVILALILVYSVAILDDIIMYFSSTTELFEIDYTFISTAPNIPNLFLK